MIDVSDYTSLVVKYKESCMTNWFLTKDDIDSIKDVVVQINKISGEEIFFDIASYTGEYYIGMWPVYSAIIEAIYFI